MEFYERMALRPVLWAKLHDLNGNAFQSFFHDLMSASVPGFVDVRTHGNIGDLASDGLSLHDGKLYASYAPETPDVAATVAKFNADLRHAIEKRDGQFSTFVFVHNDVRGTHPEISVALAGASKEHPELTFEIMGMRHIRDLMGGLDREQAETVLGVQLPLQHETTMGLHEMEDLLAHLTDQRIEADAVMPLTMVSAQKLAFSQLTSETQAELRDAMKYSKAIDDYYHARIDVMERDEVAARFHAEYSDAVATGCDAEDILLRLQIFLAGTRVRRRDEYRPQTAVLAYFFQTCDIFEDAPAELKALAIGPRP